MGTVIFELRCLSVLQYIFLTSMAWLKIYYNAQYYDIYCRFILESMI